MRAEQLTGAFLDIVDRTTNPVITRVPRHKSRTAPLSSICRLRVRPGTADEQRAVELGSGWFVSSRLLLTAAHVVDPLSRGGSDRRRIEVRSGLGGPGSSFQLPLPRRFELHPGWIGSNRRDGSPVDMAGIFFDEPHGNRLGTFEIGVVNGTKLLRQQTIVLGYPGTNLPGAGPHERVVDRLCWDMGEVKGIGAGMLRHSANTLGGQSGGPVLLPSVDGRRSRAVGIHVSALPGDLVNLGVHIDAVNARIIQDWIREADAR